MSPLSDHTPCSWLDRLPDPVQLRAMTPDARARTIGHCLRLELQHLLAVPPGHRLSPGLPLRGQGLDTLDALHLGRRIRRALDAEVPAEVLRESTVGELTALLAR
ncbi:acyl carrier protein [Streptomyces sp. NPDC059837]|uniref:acyl carrier protein n=1 Tax=unclassified Streptomyces TaxID=2593676 RepID=UPI0022519E29|nr:MULTISPECIES: acyl carrier protein [unclassified Streptomyces]MCX4408553.1 acyl carrier protein [Streptomyces sp. NBC_01764]MCX5185798.1 acyl carrier protein [Streptomyces sp. NBC_00268]